MNLAAHIILIILIIVGCMVIRDAVMPDTMRAKRQGSCRCGESHGSGVINCRPKEEIVILPKESDETV
jgi:hypothetical protein